MKQIAQNYKSGELVVLEVPAPTCRPGGVLVRSLFSLISTGTEMMKVSEASMSMVGMARARPDQVRKVIDQVQQQGVVTTYKKVMNKLDSYTPLGYSLCGVVTEVGKGAEEFKVGQLVACAGNEQALHAEYNWVPVNLCAAVPDRVLPEHAAFATVASIAMHGVRRSEVQLGETAAVIGLGLIGQLVVRLLVAAGVQAVGVDPVPDRCRLAEKAGAVTCGSPDELDTILAELGRITSGRGADHVFLSAGGSSNGPVEAAVKLARDRARIVDIGKMKLDLPWNAYYEKELDVRFSRSYGPGRYDTRYELDGIDYPAGYVRWTEKRNLESFLNLVARNELEVETLVDGIFPMGEAVKVYEDLRSGTLKAIGVLLEYPVPTEGAPAPANRKVLADSKPTATRRGPVGLASDGKKDQVSIGFVGAGNYASSMLLPHLAKLGAANLAHVATTRSLSAVNAQRKFGFATASTDSDSVFEDESLDAIFIVTRHATHAKLVCRALETGKAVYVEKPLALTRAETDQIAETVEKTGNDRLMVGFNRRFAPLLSTMRERFGAVASTSATRYLVNAGPLGKDSWYLNEEAEGSRFAGEGGHFIDTLSWWADSLVEEVYAVRGPEKSDVQATFRFANGASGTISYLAGGSVRFPKETMDATGGGRSARLDNFKTATVWTARGTSSAKARGGQDKGQQSEMSRFVDAVRTRGPMPISIDSLLATTRATIAVGESLLNGHPERA
ncbi:MAG TPA: bi-domain-containing oxidoreductase [Trebonia sp.]|jgi:predicted dehydrogenase|nr:bi-domain-containing oxidoreductase [Trebonia sp.]